MEHVTEQEHITKEKAKASKSGLKHINGYAGVPVILLNIETLEVMPGGLIVSEEKALATPCHGYDLGEGKKILWSKGVVGSLSLPEQEKFCKVGMDIKSATEPLAKRIKALREAGVTFK